MSNCGGKKKSGSTKKGSCKSTKKGGKKGGKKR